MSGRIFARASCTFNATSGTARWASARHASPVPLSVIRQLAERLELQRLRSGNLQTGPIFRNRGGKPLSLGSRRSQHLARAERLPVCRTKEHDHLGPDHRYLRDESIPQWHGWHAARRGLGSRFNSRQVNCRNNREDGFGGAGRNRTDV